MADPRLAIPGLGGFLAQRQGEQQETLGGLQSVLGVMNMLRQQEEQKQRAQLAPLQRMLMEAQVQGVQQKAQQEQAAQGLLGQLYSQYQTATQPKVVRDDIAGTDTTEPGMPQTQAQQQLFTGMLQNPALAQVGMQGLTKLEAAEGRRETAQQNYLLRAQQLQQQHTENLRRAQTEAERAAAIAEYRQAMLDLHRERNSGSGGGDRLEPFKYSVGGENVQGWRDKFGNVFDADRRAVSGYRPEITASDQNLARKNAEERAAIETVDAQLTELEKLAQSNPRSVAGPLSGVTRGVESVMSAVVPGSVGLQATTAQQLIRSIIGNLPKTGRLSNYQQQEMRRLFEDGMSGNADSLQKGIDLMRENLVPRQSATQAPTGRVTPGRAPAIGAVQQGFRFKGGDPSRQENWERVQ